MKEFIHFIESYMLSCPTKQLIHINCLGCGLQRSFILLLKGDVIASFYMYPALIPMLLMIGYLIAHVLFKLKNGARVLQYFYISNSLLIIINFIFKL
ncbi:DUF2752 domain-containing protein [Aquimarina sp. AU474]|uniref:DUF2752 domain-containing protein n=1 Tax=Aquimarina sp. AU474 TaxID=2108529 RepID=UPI00135859DE|nr:DUF2752 domain-containing protein [Aquimarina sp. AU474]